jgi:hypothetical protein
MPGSKPAATMALLTRWPTTKDDDEEEELNYAPLPHLSSSLSLSSLSLPWLLISVLGLMATSSRQARVNELAKLRLQVLVVVKTSIACESKKEIMRLRK